MVTAERYSANDSITAIMLIWNIRIRNKIQ